MLVIAPFVGAPHAVQLTAHVENAVGIAVRAEGDGIDALALLKGEREACVPRFFKR